LFWMKININPSKVQADGSPGRSPLRSGQPFVFGSLPRRPSPVSGYHIGARRLYTQPPRISLRPLRRRRGSEKHREDGERVHPGSGYGGGGEGSAGSAAPRRFGHRRHPQGRAGPASPLAHHCRKSLTHRCSARGPVKSSMFLAIFEVLGFLPNVGVLLQCVMVEIALGTCFLRTLTFGFIGLQSSLSLSSPMALEGFAVF
jgi:hypothetical protein